MKTLQQLSSQGCDIYTIRQEDYRTKLYQLALLIKKSLDDVIGTQQGACEANDQYQYKNIHFSLLYALFANSSIDTFKEMCILHNI